MPEARTIFGKLIYEKKSNKILGLQLAGKGEVTRYIDVFSALATKNSILFDLLNFEHAYTPTHSNPMNPLNFLGSLALAQENDGVYCLNPLDLKKYTGQIIDVREDSEIKFAKCPGNVIETSLSEYRNILSKFDESEPLLFVCHKGPRAYEAARYYQKQGFKDVKYIGGGLQFAKLLLDGKE
jgi:rhodanese-related sulfurtransferase